MKKLWKVVFMMILMPGAFISCQNGQGNDSKAEKAVTTENLAEKQAAKEEEAQDKAMFREKVAMYSQWDEDQNGLLNHDEFLKGAGDLFAEIDKNGNGRIEKEEWERYRQNAKDALAAEKALFLNKTQMYSQMGDAGVDKADYEKKIKEVFGTLDANGNGTIEQEEYKRFLK